MTENERQHLVAWSKAVRAIGKGTGKYAPLHRRNAREHLNESRSTIPVWVMPLHPSCLWRCMGVMLTT